MVTGAIEPSHAGSSEPFDVDAFLDARPIGMSHVRLIVLLILAMLLDGFDIFVVGMVLPFLAHDMHVTPASLTGVFIVQQFGLLIGTILIGPLSDRFGRRTTLLACIGAFTLLTLATTQTATPGQLMTLRFASSLFFAGVIPNCIALSSELAPSRWRAAIVSLVFSGFTAGIFGGAFVQAYTLEPYGWQSAFWIGGGLGGIVFALLFLFLPESIRFRVRRDPADAGIARSLQSIAPALRLGPGTVFRAGGTRERGSKAPARILFGAALRTTTLLLWVGFFCAFFVSQLMGSWNTTILHNLAGVSMQRIAAAAAIGTTAGMIGTASVGFLMDRFGSGWILPAVYVGGAVFTGLLGTVPLGSSLFFVIYAAYGYCTNAGLAGVNALGSLLYPSEARGTGVGWAAGAGRAGGMVGPAIGGVLIATGAHPATIYACAGLPLLIGAAATILIGRRTQDGRVA